MNRRFERWRRMYYQPIPLGHFLIGYYVALAGGMFSGYLIWH